VSVVGRKFGHVKYESAFYHQSSLMSGVCIAKGCTELIYNDTVYCSKDHLGQPVCCVCEDAGEEMKLSYRISVETGVCVGCRKNIRKRKI